MYSEFSEFIQNFSELSKWKQAQIQNFSEFIQNFLNLFRIFLNSANGNKYWASLKFRIFLNLFRIFLNVLRIFRTQQMEASTGQASKAEFLNLLRVFLNLFVPFSKSVFQYQWIPPQTLQAKTLKLSNLNPCSSQMSCAQALVQHCLSATHIKLSPLLSHT